MSEMTVVSSLLCYKDSLLCLCILQAGLLKPDVVEGSNLEIPEFNVSYKPQKISPKFQSTVRHLLHQKIRDSYMHPQFCSDVMKPLQIEQLMDQEVVNLSGGELQRVALTLCLGKVIFLPLCRTAVLVVLYIDLVYVLVQSNKLCIPFSFLSLNDRYFISFFLSFS